MIRELVLVCSLLAGDWPQFRGPLADGHAPGPVTPMEWSDHTNVVWKAAVPGLGWSSPVIAEGKVFLTTAVPKGEGLSLLAMAFDAQTGDVAWTREVRSVDEIPGIHAKNSHASPTPLYREEAVFVHFGTLGTARLRASDGTIDWLCTDLIYNPVHGSGGSPLLHEDRLVVVCDGSSDPFVAGLDAGTGKIVWRTPRSVEGRINHSFGTPALAVVDGRPQAVAPGPEMCAAYDLHTGEELWRVRAPGWSVVPQPAVGHGLVIYNHDYDHPELLAVRPDGAGDVTESHVVWRLKRGAPSTPSPLLIGDELYFVSDRGIATCVDARTGTVHWTERLGGNFSASPVFANEAILFLNEDGQATWVARGTEFARLGTCEVSGRTFATPAFSEGSMYLRTDSALYRIGG